MLKFSGHTMGTPGMDIAEAMRLFGKLGFDGIEVRLSDQGTIDPVDLGEELAATINGLVDETGVAIACLTPYFRQFHIPAEREAEMDGFRSCIRFAPMVNCSTVRLFAAKNPPMEGLQHEQAYAAWIEAARALGQEAAEAGVDIAIESHGGTFATTLERTVQIVKDIAVESVGVLMDYGNVYQHGPRGREAVRFVAPYLKHVHMKDKLVDENGEAHGEGLEFGKGNIGWPEVLAELVAIGFDGYVSDEYERCWHPELPPAEVAMKQHIDWLRAWREANVGP